MLAGRYLFDADTTSSSYDCSLGNPGSTSGEFEFEGLVRQPSNNDPTGSVTGTGNFAASVPATEETYDFSASFSAVIPEGEVTGTITSSPATPMPDMGPHTPYVDCWDDPESETESVTWSDFGAYEATLETPTGAVQEETGWAEFVLQGFSPGHSDFNVVFAHNPAEPICDGPLAQDDVLPFDGDPPPLSPFPNDDAACAAVWVPELEDGFVAQGLALMDDGTALLSGYIHPLGDPKDDDSGEYCRIAQVDLITGDLLGDSYDFEPSTCKHGGGIAIDSDGRVWIADTKKLILLTGADIFTDPIPVAAKLGKGEGLKGSFLVDGRSDHLWVGLFLKKKDGHPAGKIYEFETDYLETRATLHEPVKRGATTDIRNVPTETQGAAFKDGALFAAISRNSKTGSLKTDHGTFGFGPGVEEIQFEGECLWAVFEAGARIYQKKSFPVIARFDPGLIPDPFDPHPECVAE